MRAYTRALSHYIRPSLTRTRDLSYASSLIHVLTHMLSHTLSRIYTDGMGQDASVSLEGESHLSDTDVNGIGKGGRGENEGGGEGGREVES